MDCGCFDALLRKKADPSHSQEDFDEFPTAKKVALFSYDELRFATSNFHKTNKIGHGGFGIVYKGTLRNGRLVAVKVLSASSRQGVDEFLTEIDVITHITHSHLVELIGCCIEGKNRILIYEYMENNSLDHALLGSKSDSSKLDWGIRSAICIGTARGLSFLHEELPQPIVHRDIKASNILLDINFVPKIGDFGLAKLFPDNVTHISTRVAGTTGYLAPEYALHGQLTKKADIYSFGVLIIEIISGRSISRTRWSEMEQFLLERAWQLYEEGKLIELVDPNLKDYDEEEVVRYLKVALFCTQAAAKRRPSMPQVLEMLSRPIRLNETELTPPGFTQDSDNTGKNFNTVNTSNIRMKESSSFNSAYPFSSAPDTNTELVPR